MQVIRKEGNQAYCASVAAISRALETGEEHTKEQLIPVLGLVLKTVVGLPEHQAVLRLLAVSCQGIWSTLVASLLSVTELLVFGLAISDVGDSELQKEGRKGLRDHFHNCTCSLMRCSGHAICAISSGAKFCCLPMIYEDQQCRYVLLQAGSTSLLLFSS